LLKKRKDAQRGCTSRDGAETGGKGAAAKFLAVPGMGARPRDLPQRSDKPFKLTQSQPDEKSKERKGKRESLFGEFSHGGGRGVRPSGGKGKGEPMGTRIYGTLR